jgi:hypothetical protein
MIKISAILTLKTNPNQTHPRQAHIDNAYERELAQPYPDNHHIRYRIRQQLFATTG